MNIPIPTGSLWLRSVDGHRYSGFYKEGILHNNDAPVGTVFTGWARSDHPGPAL